LKRWIERLPAKEFIRVHKSFIVNIYFIGSVNESITNERKIQMIYPEKSIPVSRRFWSRLNASFKP
jgi:DNA-binding LytR/AlgR family response regulator